MTDHPTLDDLAREFADTLTDLTRGVLGEDTPRFYAKEIAADRHVQVHPGRERAEAIPVRIGGTHRIDLIVKHFCCWDGESRFIAVDHSEIKVHYTGVADPLFRFEYERQQKDPPGAHIHVHGHRDEVAYLLRLAETGRPVQKLKRDAVPKSSEMHLPVGGHRMRPTLEDVLLFLVREFAVDTAPEWKAVLERHVRQWRTIQLKASVRDAPEAAAEVLRGLGYEVRDPVVPAQRDSGPVKLFLP